MDIPLQVFPDARVVDFYKLAALDQSSRSGIFSGGQPQAKDADQNVCEKIFHGLLACGWAWSSSPPRVTVVESNSRVFSMISFGTCAPLRIFNAASIASFPPVGY